MKFLTLAFLHDSGEPDEPWMNRLTAFVSKYKVYHVELGFEDGNHFSIMHGGCVTFRIKTLDNPLYEIISLQVTDEQYMRCYGLCVNLTKQKIAYDDWGVWGLYMYKCTSVCIPQSPEDVLAEPKTFCSKIVTAVLQQVNVSEVQHLHPSTTTPSDLLEAVHKFGNTTVAYTRFNRPYFKLQIPHFF